MKLNHFGPKLPGEILRGAKAAGTPLGGRKGAYKVPKAPQR